MSLLVYLLLLLVYAVFSFSFTDPNLVFTSNELYWQFQSFMWRTFFSNERLQATLYSLLVISLSIAWVWLAHDLKTLHKKGQLTMKRGFLVLMLASLPLIFSYNALSHDVFNYMFNAKMVIEYGKDPHVFTALDFPNDLWTRFMHNTHTAAPYGYGWTGLSLLPYSLGFSLFSITWIIFKLFSVASLFLTYFLLLRIIPFFKRTLNDNVFAVLITLLHPFVLIEVVSNAHNDLWMMVFALASVFIALSNRLSFTLRISVSLLLLTASISIKYATAVLLPWILLLLIIKDAGYLQSFVTGIKKFALRFLAPLLSNMYLKLFPTVAVLSLCILFLLPKSQFFHPWYFLWIIVWLPLLAQKKLASLLLISSSVLLLRYIPWIWSGGYADNTTTWQMLISFTAVVLLPSVLVRFKRIKILQFLYE